MASDVIRCNLNAVTEIELAVMQLLNDSLFRVTAEANQSAFGSGPTYGSLAFLPLYDFRGHIRDAAGIENSSVGE
jgi:hypothetical protein